jgi:very-short-patch-repair endonuclease
VIGPYIVDFYCPAAQLIIEADGESHAGREGKDEERQRWLEKEGCLVLRFWDTDLFRNLKGALEMIWAACNRQIGKSGYPSPLPLSPKGRGG